MDVSELHRLGRRLVSLARTAAGADEDSAEGLVLVLVPGQEAVLEDLLRHPGSTVTTVRNRTGFTQSHVSASVAKLRAMGLIDARPDPRDGRRTLLTPTAEAMQTIIGRARRDVTAAISATTSGPAQAARALAILEELQNLLDDAAPAS